MRRNAGNVLEATKILLVTSLGTIQEVGQWYFKMRCEPLPIGSAIVARPRKRDYFPENISLFGVPFYMRRILQRVVRSVIWELNDNTDAWRGRHRVVPH